MTALDVGKIEDESFYEYLRRSPEWVKSGSALGAKLDFRLTKTTKVKMRLNKRAAMNYSEPTELANRLYTMPVMCAGSAAKFENAK